MTRHTGRLLTAILACLLAITITACGTKHPQAAGGSIHPPGWGKPAPQSFNVSPSSPAIAPGTMYDDVTLNLIPSPPFAVAGYLHPSSWPTYPTIRSRWPHSHAISIAVQSYVHANCLDVEPGDAIPSQVVSWIRADRAAGFKKPCVYSSFYEYFDQIRPLLARAGVARNSIFEWDASYTGRPGLTQGFDATQYTDRALGRSLDASIVTKAFLSIATPVYIDAKPKPDHVACAPFKPQSSARVCRSLRLQGQRIDSQIVGWRKVLRAHDCYRHHGRVSTHPKWSCRNELTFGDNLHAKRRALLAEVL